MNDTASVGILPCQSIEDLIAQDAITSLTPFDSDQVQPASLDLRLGARVWRVRASFLPGLRRTVRDRLPDVAMHELDLTKGAVLVTGIGGIALLLGAFLVIRSAMRPLEHLTRDLSQRDPYDLTPMAADGPAEVAVMVHAMNRFMQRLDRQVGAMKHLISDTAHQLRTPVAAIRAQAELAIEDDPTYRSQRLERLVRRTRSLGTLLDQMLSRAMVIHRTDNAPPSAVDLRDVALKVFEDRDHEVLAPQAEVGLEIGDMAVIVMADEISLSEAAKNMLANALRHGTSPITIGVCVDQGMGEIWVQDAGSGPAEDVIDTIGQRFERSAASKGNSAGLGLSIVRAVAEAFDGKVHMARTDQGFRVSLALPADQNAEAL